MPQAGDTGRPGTGIGLQDRLLMAAFLAVSLALVVTTFGDTNRGVDETFYFLVGQRMHEGVLPYVGVWDRKPLGLFLVYWAIAGISTSVLGYQIAAWLLTALCAFIIARIVRPWAGGQGALFAGLAYILVIGAFDGDTGQTSDFYNPLIAGAAMLILGEGERLVRREVGWRTWTAMALCGLAITIKQTTFFESAFFGLLVLVQLHRAGAPPRQIAAVAAGCAAIGLLPSLLIAGYYWQSGHWSEFWHAMATSNLAKAGIAGKGQRLLGIVLRLALLLPLAVWGILSFAPERRTRLFLAGWLVAAFLGFLAVPNVSVHYALPLIVPLCIAAGLPLGRHGLARVFLAAIGLYACLWYLPPGPAYARASSRAMAEAARMIRAHDAGGGLLAYDAPPYLYALSGERFLSPLVFPHHLSSDIENDVSHLATHREIDRVLAARPGVIVMAQRPYIFPINAYTRVAVLAYARRNCRLAGRVTLLDNGKAVPFVVLGDCVQEPGIPPRKS